jgi:hypothetical protein
MLFNSPLERGRGGRCCGGGVFASMLVNIPLRPSQEGIRTAPCFFLRLYISYS